MLKRITTLPTDKPIVGAHLIPFTADGHIVMGWCRGRGLLETLGGRLEAGESIEDALRREAMEEAGLRIKGPFIPLASYYWESTDTYTVWFVGRVAGFEDLPPGFETTGRVLLTPETAREIIRHLPHDKAKEMRCSNLTWAEEVYAATPR